MGESVGDESGLSVAEGEVEEEEEAEEAEEEEVEDDRRECETKTSWLSGSREGEEQKGAAFSSGVGGRSLASL